MKKRIRLKGRIRTYIQFTLYLGLLLLAIDAAVFMLDFRAGLLTFGFTIFYFAITLTLYFYNKPIIIFNIKGYYDNLWEFIEFAITEGFVKEACKELTFMTSSPAELLDYLNQYDPNKVIKTEKLKYIENY